MFSTLLSFALAHIGTITAVASGAAGFKVSEVGIVTAVAKVKAWLAAKAAKVEADAAAVEAKAKADAAQLDALIGAHVNAALADVKKALGITPLAAVPAPTQNTAPKA
jgi:hypothetical protein